MTKSKWQMYWENIRVSSVKFLWTAVKELVAGVCNDRVDLGKYVYPGLIVAALFVAHMDSLLAYLSGHEWLELSFGLREFIVYASLFSGWVIWACQRAFLRTKLLMRLRDAFLYCGLEINNRLPAFIEDQPIDEHVRNLKLYTQGLPVKKFLDNKDNLEAYLNISIVKIRDENGDKGRINILYAMRPLDHQALLDGSYEFADGEIPIGISYEGPIVVNLREVVHILIAGQTGGGKSNIEKVVTVVLVMNNKGSDVYYLDFKGGMELADLTNRLGDNFDNFHKYEGPKASARFLAELGEKIESRLQTIAKAGCSNLDDYLAKDLGNKTTTVSEETGIEKPSDELKRTYIVIDEIAQLYARDPSISKEDLAKARDAVNRIARQGRAAGIHLIVATQKPDSQSFDQTVKANLPAVLCFPMPSQAASVSALGTKRAFDLNPEIKGRAIWKYGPTMTEVQTYLFQ
jgi:energy-coupling factor transporter ATP-binding protein EcfA2